MHYRFRRTIIISTGVAVLSALVHAYSDSDSAGVLLAEKWKSDAGSISAGAAIPLKTTLSTSDPTELVLKCPTGVLSYTCSKTPCRIQACANPVTDAAVRRLDKGDTTESSSLLSIFKRAPTATVSTVVRGEANPNDAIILLKSDQIHLAPALNRILEGNYCFALQSLERSGAPPVFAKLAWNKDDEPEGIVRVPGLQPGAYALEKRMPESAGACSADPNAVPAWVVVAPENQFYDLTDQWKGKRPWFDELAASGNSPAAIATMRHLVIADLSQSVRH